MVIDNEDEDDVDMSDAVAGEAYRESMTSVDGFTRGPNGRVKFNKDTKKRRREADEVVEDVEMGDADVGAGRKPDKRRSDPKLGKEFKAKVCDGSRYYNISLNIGFRKLGAMLRKAAWILTLTCRCLKRQKRRDATNVAVLPAKNETCIMCGVVQISSRYNSIHLIPEPRGG